MKVLVFAAHPDDEVLGCGGTMTKLSRGGQEVYVTILGEGLTSRYPDRAKADPKAVDALAQRSREVARLLGAREVTLHGLPDNRFDTLPLLDVVKIVEERVGRVRPEAIFTHHGGDLNIDHATTYRAVLTATRPVPGGSVKDVYSFESPSSTEWAFDRTGSGFAPNVFWDIRETLETKVQAMSHYETEVREFPHPRSPDALRAIARRWGSVVGLEAAEAFELVRSIRAGER